MPRNGPKNGPGNGPEMDWKMDWKIGPNRIGLGGHKVGTLPRKLPGFFQSRDIFDIERWDVCNTQPPSCTRKHVCVLWPIGQAALWNSLVWLRYGSSVGAFLDARQLSWTTNRGHSNGHDSGLSHRHRHGSLSSSSLPLASSLPSLSLLSTWSRSGERPSLTLQVLCH